MRTHYCQQQQNITSHTSMKTENRELLGFVVPIVGIAETLAEAISAAGSEEAVLKDFNNNVLAHSHYTIARRVIIKTLVDKTGIKLKTKKDGEKEVIAEKDAEYIARLESELGEETVKSYSSAVANAVNEVKVDYTPGVRGTGAGTSPAKKWLAFYDQLVAEEKLDAFCQKHSINQEVEEDELKKVVANRVKEIVTAKEQEIARNALAV